MDRQGYLEGARALLSAYSQDPDGLVARIQAGHDPHTADNTIMAATTHGATSPSRIHLDTSNFVDKDDWSQIDILYASSESFDDALMMDIAKHCRRAHLPTKSKVVTLAKPLPPLSSSAEAPQRQASSGDDGRATVEEAQDTSGPTPEGEWKVLWQCQMQTPRGETLVAYVHHFVPLASV